MIYANYEIFLIRILSVDVIRRFPTSNALLFIYAGRVVHARSGPMCHENHIIGLMPVRCAMGIDSLD